MAWQTIEYFKREVVLNYPAAKMMGPVNILIPDTLCGSNNNKYNLNRSYKQKPLSIIEFAGLTNARHLLEKLLRHTRTSRSTMDD